MKPNLPKWNAKLSQKAQKKILYSTLIHIPLQKIGANNTQIVLNQDYLSSFALSRKTSVYLNVYTL